MTINRQCVFRNSWLNIYPWREFVVIRVIGINFLNFYWMLNKNIKNRVDQSDNHCLKTSFRGAASEKLWWQNISSCFLGTLNLIALWRSYIPYSHNSDSLHSEKMFVCLKWNTFQNYLWRLALGIHKQVQSCRVSF